MKSTILKLVLLTGLVSVGCSVDATTERTATTSAALDEPALTPVPCAPDPNSTSGYSKQWEGTVSDLLFADALVECSAKADGTFWPLYAYGDLYLSRVVTFMLDAAAATGHAVGTFLPDEWYALRGDKARTCDSTTLTLSSSGPVRLQHIIVKEFIDASSFPFNQEPDAASANNELRTAGLNYCVAQTLRRQVPGSCGGESLLFPAYEQRQLLELVRERSQIAMLQYALLGELFVSNISSANEADNNGYQIAGYIHDWAATHTAFLDGMGRDFAGAVQLNHTVTEEVTRLFARSRFADTSAVPPSATLADQYWGTASWLQRGMAFAFGGDPLVIAANGSWPQTSGSSRPGTYTGRDWPQYTQAPYARTNVQSPQVHELWLLAKRFGAARLFLQYTSASQLFSAMDPLPTAAYIYNVVEANLRVAECYPFDPNPPPTGTCPTTLPTTLPGTYLLQSQYNISFDDAVALALLLGDETVGLTVDNVTVVGDTTNYFTGALDIVGQDTTAGTVAAVATNILQLSSKADFVPRSLVEIGPVYAAAAPLRFPTVKEIDPDVDAGSLAMAGACGFNGSCSSPYLNDAAEAKRTLGALGANNATREMVMDAVNHLGAAQSPVQAYFATAPVVVGTITGTVGADGVKIVPEVFKTRTAPGFPVPIYAQDDRWAVSATHAANDPFWSANGNTYTVYALRGLNVTNLAAHPEVTWNGDSLNAHVAFAFNNGLYATLSTQTSAVAGEQVAVFKSMPLTFTSQHWTFIVAAGAPAPSLGGGSATSATAAVPFRLLGGDVYIDLSSAHYGQELAYAGTLGVWMTHQNQPWIENPSEPAYDGFDLPIHWVPPFSAQVLGGNPGDSIVASYLSLASTAASNATSAAQTALDGLIQQAQSDALKQQAAQQSALEVNQAQAALCGASNLACDTNVSLVVAGQIQISVNGQSIPLYTAVPDGPQQGNSSDPSDQLQHFVYELVQPFMQSQVFVAEAVQPYLGNSGAPSFPEYAGGSLQQAFIQQWAALRDPIGKMTALVDNKGAALAQVNVANEQVKQLNAEQQQKCGAVASIKGLLSGISVSFPAAISFSPGALMAQLQACNDVEGQLDVAKQQVIAAQNNALSQLAAAAADFSNAAAAMAESGAVLQSQIQQAQAAQTKAILEAQLTAQSQQTSFGIFRLYHDYDTWRAVALLENARIYALAARRAIEARYVVDLSRLSQPEAFVASPATWANGIYRYDLSMPSSVGLQIGNQSQTQGGGVYVNQVADYVTNLQGFVAGYAVNRPSAVAQDELDVIALPGLAPGSPVTIQDGGQTFPPAYVGMGNWTLHCAGTGSGGQWVPVPVQGGGGVAGGDVDHGCAGVGGAQHPDMARLEFTLDAWGRVNGFVAQPPFGKRFNSRWTQLAVNFVGTAVKDCTQAVDPQGCYAQEYIAYNLTHGAPAWVTDYDEVWHGLDIPTGQIEGGKGLAAEVWLDPLKDGWSTSFISAIARTEYELRPLGGAYTIEFPVGPEVILSRIERVQVLIGSTTWVKQQ